ncbi:hypothetical protein R8Z57_08145 [Microbacterium sp. M3]|uniref:Uncharacterized protein n=1 Tax=Microbacterium arthrosphaerae TaxID=792652 RepID=A0ABU4H0B4_9MICO|nr:MULTISPECIES: hypothetical protein [Microbacterium]MDW4572743.1 hypothetical protein [Microbacterium arthrosphaerae]MDW7606598.1 hypothetical protein [Microbacterium sp. M3]
MSTPEHPATPALTRKQIRELRNTGSTPVITAGPAADEPDAAPSAPAAPPVAAAPPSALPVTPFPRPADPAPVAPPPVADSAVDLGVSPLTRRQARQQERIRTASVPVITPEVVAAHAAASAAPAPALAFPVAAPPQTSSFGEPEPPLFTAPDDASAVSTDSGMHALFGIPRDAESTTPPKDSSPWAAPATGATSSEPETAAGDARDEDDPFGDVLGAAAPAADAAEEQQKSVVSPTLGASLLDDQAAPAAPQAVEFPPSFDQLLSRTTGSIAVPNTLIVSQAPEVSPLVAPVTATGEVIVTGTFNLPEGLGSTGHAKGTADGKEIDATLVDGELPSHSSPTPIAASAAVSTVKTPGEVIKPPVPEKGGKLMMSLAITAGVLALALVGVLILAFVTGVF